MRKIIRAGGFAALFAASLMWTSGVLLADSGPAVHVTAVVTQGAVRLEARASGPFEYTTYRPNENLFVVDLSGVSTTEASGARVLQSDLVSSYRLLQSPAGAKPLVRLEVLLRTSIEPRVVREGPADLILIVERPESAAIAKPPSKAIAKPAAKPAVVATATNSPARTVKSESRPAVKAATLTSTGSKRAAAPKTVSQPTVKPAAHPSTTATAAKTPATPKTVPALEAIQQVQVTKNGQQTEVHVAGSGHLVYHVLRLSQPERLVLDFDGTRVATSQKSINSDLAPVREVRVAQFTPDKSRVVIDLQKSAAFHVRENENSITVAFDSAPVAKAALVPVKSAATKPVSTTVVVHSKSKPEKPAKSASARPSVAQSMRLPANLTQPAAAMAHPVPVTVGAAAKSETPAKSDLPVTSAPPAETPVTAPVKSENTVPGAAPTETAVTAPAKTETIVKSDPPATTSAPAPPSPAPAVVQEPTPAQAEPAKAATPQPSNKYSGEPIAVNFKDVDLKDFFRLIHEISGLNVVVDPAVKGTLTLVLDEVPWDQALDIVLHNNDLDKQLDGNVLRVATKETLKKEAEQSRDLAKAQAEAADTTTTTRVLSYAKASDMVATLKKFLSSRGDILADERSNTLIIRDIPSVMPTMDNLIRQLDRKSQQVEIEARVVAANRSFAREIGTQFAFATSATHGRNIFGGASSVGTSPLIRNHPPLPIPPLVIGSGTGGGTTSSSSLPLNTNLQASVPTSGVSYLFSSPNFALDFIITAAETKGVGKLLSKPKVITQNNQRAVVKQGTKIPIQTIINNTVSVQFIDAVLRLEVTPQITSDGTVFMDVTVENTQIDPAIPRVNGIPALDTQSAETKVLINDGGTVVVGGIIISSQRTDIAQVPLFGSIPLLGNLFKHTTVSSTSQELLFFLTPRILPT